MHQIDVNSFYDNILTSIYEYQSIGTIYVCGDFNSRIGDSQDFIEGIDVVPNRDVVETTFNDYGAVLLEFLINSNFCVLNGRNYLKNDFTCIRPQGCSVVDYCLISQNNLSMFRDFGTIRPSEFVNETGVVPVSIPVHSFISWSIDIPVNINSSSNNTVFESWSVKYDVNNIQDEFLLEQEIVSDLHNTVFNLEASHRTQNDIDNTYKILCNNIKKEMAEKLNKCNVKIGNASSNKRRKIGKPWWNETLTYLWNEVCISEKLFLSCNDVCKRKRLRVEFVKCRKIFNRNVQKYKRHFWFNMQSDLLDDVKSNSCNFWKSIGKIGVAFKKKHKIPMEVVDNEGNIVTDKEFVSGKIVSNLRGAFNKF